MNLKKYLHAALSIALGSTLATASYAQQTKTIETGLTTVQLSNTFLTALTTLDVQPGVVFPTHLYKGVVSFPITSGAIDPDTAKGNVLHSGGLTLTARGTEVRLQSFLIDTAGKPLVITGLVVVSGRVNGRIPLFDLSLPPGVTLPLSTGDGFQIDIKGVGVTLDHEAAAALNGVYDTKAFKGGLDIGTAEVDAFIDPTKE